MGSSFGIQGRFDGTMTVAGNWVQVSIPAGTVRTYQRDPQMYWDLRVRAALVACTSARASATVSESMAVRMAPLLGIAERAGTLDTATRVMKDTLRLSVAIPPGTVAERSWIVLLFEWPFENVFATYELATDLLNLGTGARAKPEGRVSLGILLAPSSRCR